MFNIKAMGAVAGLLQNKDKLVAAGQRVKATLDERPAVGESGGGAVKVTINGSLQVKKIELTPALAASMGTDQTSSNKAAKLIAEAVNDGLAKGKERMAEALRKEAKDLGLDDLPFDISKLLS